MIFRLPFSILVAASVLVGGSAAPARAEALDVTLQVGLGLPGALAPPIEGDLGGGFQRFEDFSARASLGLRARWWGLGVLVGSLALRGPDGDAMAAWIGVEATGYLPVLPRVEVYSRLAVTADGADDRSFPRPQAAGLDLGVGLTARLWTQDQRQAFLVLDGSAHRSGLGAGARWSTLTVGVGVRY